VTAPEGQRKTVGFAKDESDGSGGHEDDDVLNQVSDADDDKDKQH